MIRGPRCFAARMYNSSFSQYLGSRGSLAEYDALSICRQLLVVIPRSSLAHLLAASERLSALEESYFLGWVRRRGSRPCRISCVSCAEQGFFLHHLDMRWLFLRAFLPELGRHRHSSPYGSTICHHIRLSVRIH